MSCCCGGDFSQGEKIRSSGASEDLLRMQSLREFTPGSVAVCENGEDSASEDAPAVVAADGMMLSECWEEL